MRRRFLLSAAAAFVFAGAAWSAPQAPRKAPEFVVSMVDGPQKALTSLRGKSVVMAFLFTTCPHCRTTAGVLAKVQEEYAAKGVQVVGVAFDTGAQAGVQKFSDELQLNFPLGYSSQMQALEFLQFPIDEPYFVPVLVFIDRTGTIRSQYMGDEAFLQNQDLSIRAEVENLLHGAVSVARPAAKAAPKQ